MNIGDWVRRKDGKWHAVESIVSDDPITHCGRRLKERRWKGVLVPFEVSDVMPLTRMIDQPQLCKRCA